MTQWNLHNPQLEGDDFLWPAGPTGVLLLHGLTATTAEVRPLARRLHRYGLTVAGPLLEGHGTSPAHLRRTKWSDWFWSAAAAYHELATLTDTVLVGGESTGALLALLLAVRYHSIAGVLCYAPAMQLNLTRYDWLRLHLLAPLVESVPKTNMAGDQEWQGYDVRPLQSAVELLKLARVVRRKLVQIRQPLLVVQGRLDQTIRPESGRLILEGASSDDKALYWLEDSGHVIVLEGELDEIEVRSLRFIERATALATAWPEP